MIADYGGSLPHSTYLARLRAEHPRKTSFWAEVA